MTKSGILLSVLALVSLGACSGMRGGDSERQQENMARERSPQKQESIEMNSSDSFGEDAQYETYGTPEAGSDHPASGSDMRQEEEAYESTDSMTQDEQGSFSEEGSNHPAQGEEFDRQEAQDLGAEEIHDHPAEGEDSQLEEERKERKADHEPGYEIEEEENTDW